MIETNFIETLRKEAEARKQKDISDEWTQFTKRIREFLLEKAKEGKTRANFPLEHEDNIALAKTYLQRHGFTVGTYSSNTGRGIMIDF